MKPLPYRKVFRALNRLGFQATRQKGSHVRFEHLDGRKTSVPNHPGSDVAPGTIRAICDQIEITPDEFLRHL